MLKFKGGVSIEMQRERLDRSHVVAKLAALRREYPAALQSYDWAKNPMQRRAAALAARRIKRAAIKG